MEYKLQICAIFLFFLLKLEKSIKLFIFFLFFFYTLPFQNNVEMTRELDQPGLSNPNDKNMIELYFFRFGLG